MINEPTSDDMPDPAIEFAIVDDLERASLTHDQRAKLLIELLRSGDEIPRMVRAWLADALDGESGSEFRLTLKRRSAGKPPHPFPKPIAETGAAAREEAKKLRAKGVKAPRKKSAELIGAKRKVKPETVERYGRKIKKAESNLRN